MTLCQRIARDEDAMDALKFVDLTRNYTATAGSDDFELGAAVAGYSGFSETCQIGDCFYYSAIGIDHPREREVGLGTLLPGGFVRREPLSGVRTNFTSGMKSLALIARAEASDALT
jgi:hypothetical protein